MFKSGKKRMFTGIVLAASVVLSGCGGKETDTVTDRAVAVETETIGKGTLKVENSYIGTVMDEGAVNVTPLVSAEVLSVEVSVGDRVEAGDVLCRLDDTEARFNLENAQTSYANAKNGLENAQANYQKAAASYNTQVASYNNTVATADAKLGSAQQLSEYNDAVTLDNLRKQLERYREDYKEQEDDADDLSDARKKAKKEMDAAKAEYDALVQQKAGLEEKKQAIKEAAAAESAIAQEAAAQNSDTESQQGEAAAQTSDAETQSSDEAAQTSASDSAALEEQTQETEQQLAEVETQLAAALEKYEAAKAKYEALKEKEDAADDMVEQMEDTLSDKEAALTQEEYRQSITHGLGKEETQLSVDTTKAAALSNVNAALINMETSQIGIDSAYISINSAQVAVDSAEYKLGLYTITAPISGVVEQVNLTAHNLSASGQVGFVVTESAAKSVAFYVQNDVREEMEAGQKVTISCEDKQYQGVIDEIGVAVDARTGMFLVKAVISNGNELANGTLVELTTMAHEENNAPLIPLDAVYFNDGEPYIYLYEDGVAVVKPIEIALHSADQVAVTDKTLEGKELIVSWSSSLKDGAKVHKSGDKETEQNKNSGNDAAGEDIK